MIAVGVCGWIEEGRERKREGGGEVCAKQENTRWISLDFPKAQDQGSRCYVGPWALHVLFSRRFLACRWLLVVVVRV